MINGEGGLYFNCLSILRGIFNDVIIKIRKEKDIINEIASNFHPHFTHSNPLIDSVFYLADLLSRFIHSFNAIWWNYWQQFNRKNWVVVHKPYVRLKHFHSSRESIKNKFKLYDNYQIFHLWETILGLIALKVKQNIKKTWYTLDKVR